jgi:hypothetical protein
MCSDLSIRALLGLWAALLTVMSGAQPTLLFDRLGAPQGLHTLHLHRTLHAH